MFWTPNFGLEERLIPLNPDVERFLVKLKQATGQVEGQYFQVQTFSENGSSVVNRERAYCYELYRQLRIATQGEPIPYTLKRELDKHGHEIIRKPDIPDSPVHVPGKMNHNLVAMEVKHIDNITRREILKDCQKLRRFVNEAQYKGAVYLVFGSQRGDIEGFRQLAKEQLSGLTSGGFVLLWHKQVSECANTILCL
jgi:hypothetical protein